MSRFNLDFRESLPKFLSPNSFSSMAKITPHYESLLVAELSESENPTQSLRIIISENIHVSSAAVQ